jgi:transketolase
VTAIAAPHDALQSQSQAHASRLAFARAARAEVVRMVHRARASHVGGALSMIDILAALYGPGGRLRIDPQQPQWSDRDRFILSKGHACTGLYATLALAGFLPVAALESYARDDSALMSHASHTVPGIELSTGSLGHGLPVGGGLAYGARVRGQAWRTVVLLSDGELDEGSNWEAILFAGHHRLDRLWAVIDANQIQSLGHVADVLDLEPLGDKFRAFGWSVVDIDGHDPEALHASLDLANPPEPGKPTVVIARTIKGRGVSFMEDSIAWHYKSPTDAQRADALAELGMPDAE